eukprot:TRINITY_DN6368_c0_g1_i1.p1 TRINITY_DN6368_c0_g1~~TRINITY_DN6368_c0_g1_i1.p1  ORF type:complete len:326 (-),score=59.96 TRINITY_DN6368_c0_g1_i1:659-1636(-)
MQEEEWRRAKQKGDELFLLLDTDKDGSISQKELEEARSLLAGCTVDDLGAMDLGEFNGLDNNGDGQADKLEWNDFISSLIGVVGHRKFLACANAWIELLTKHVDQVSEIQVDPLINSLSEAKDQALESPVVVQTPADKPSATKKTTASSTRRPSRSKTAGTASGSTEEEQAALKIQSSFRGNKARKTAPVRRKSSVVPGQTSGTRPPAPPVKRPERKLTTMEEVWNILCAKFAVESSRKIELDDLVGYLAEMEGTGLGMELATLVPMANKDDAVPEILSPEELAHLGRINFVKRTTSSLGLKQLGQIQNCRLSGSDAWWVSWLTS